MSNKTPRNDDNADKTPGDTRVRKDEDAAPRLPHEHDESADSQVDRQPADQERARKGHDDLERGVVDTDKGPVTDRTYQKQK